jgi:hypothetical protein
MRTQHILLAAALLTIGIAGSASAQDPHYYGMPYGPGMGAPGAPGCETPEMLADKQKYGWHPFFKNMFSSKPCNGADCAKDKSHGFFSKTKPSAPPPAVGGTLVFPHHPFVRSPRDWFMED